MFTDKRFDKNPPIIDQTKVIFLFLSLWGGVGWGGVGWGGVGWGWMGWVGWMGLGG